MILIQALSKVTDTQKYSLPIPRVCNTFSVPIPVYYKLTKAPLLPPAVLKVNYTQKNNFPIHGVA